ncbi:MAG: LytTR family DNA-binding domain-containing protein, partial [Bacteroidetes bacterium]|nr:LytTR family DNA-binding domain-containing protein [Bacteroidota bacterium]
CDISMPVIDGYSVYKELNKNPDTAVIPFIFLTAKAEMNDLKFGLQLGADDYLCKPYSSNELINSIEQRIRKKENLINYYTNGKDVNDESPLNQQQVLDKESRILLIVNGRPQNFRIGGIVYIESMEKYSTIFTADGQKSVVKRMMKEWDKILPCSIFMRIHRRTIINLDFAKKFEKWSNYSYRVYLDKVDEPFIVSRRNSKRLRMN